MNDNTSVHIDENSTGHSMAMAMAMTSPRAPSNSIHNRTISVWSGRMDHHYSNLKRITYTTLKPSFTFFLFVLRIIIVLMLTMRSLADTTDNKCVHTLPQICATENVNLLQMDTERAFNRLQSVVMLR